MPAEIDLEWWRYRHVEISGKAFGNRQYLLDNRTHDGIAGYHVYVPMLVMDLNRIVLVNRGWVAAGPDRERLPDVSLVRADLVVFGIVDQPRHPLLLGDDGYAQSSWPKVVQRIDFDKSARDLKHQVLPFVVLMDAVMPDGFVREWTPYLGIGPDRHRGYAFQCSPLRPRWPSCGLSSRPVAREDTEQRRRVRRGNRFVLIGLFVLFLAPILVAYALNVWWPNWSPFGQTNHGELLEPSWTFEFPTSSPDAVDRVAGRWILLQSADSECDDACTSLLDLTRRVHVSLGKDHDRVVRMLAYRDGLAVDHVKSVDADLIPLAVPATWFDHYAGDVPALLLIDPQRQAVLRYGHDLQGKGLAKDLARVLKISKIG